MEIYLIRHTKPSIEAGICYGQTDVALDTTFENEALLIRESLKNIKFDAVFSSPLTRCTRLASFLFSDFSQSPFLLEMNFGNWEGWLWEEIFKDVDGKEWMDNYLEVKCPNGESFTDLKNRVQEFFNKMRNSGHSRVAAVTHAGVIRVAKGLCEGIKDEDIFSTHLDYGEIYKAII